MNKKGVEKDYKLALNYFKQAANQPAKRKLDHIEIPNVGKAEAEHSLALAYYGGIYVEKDVREAIKWYERAVEHNCAPSANNLGLIYFGGEDVEQDLDKAERLFILGYKLGDFNTMINLVNLYLQQGNREMALIWHERALEKGCLFSINRDEEVRQHLKDKHKTTYLGKRFLILIMQDRFISNFTNSLSFEREGNRRPDSRNFVSQCETIACK